MRAQAELTHHGSSGEPLLQTAIVDVTDERAGFDAAPIGMLESDPDKLCVLRVNDALCAILDDPAMT